MGNDNLSGKVLINSQEDSNVSDQSEVDSNESVSFENKINQKNLSISHISDIFQTMFSKKTQTFYRWFLIHWFYSFQIQEKMIQTRMILSSSIYEALLEQFQ